MPPPVKTRPYDASQRRKEARKNRLAILDAARRLFRAGGYARTSIVTPTISVSTAAMHSTSTGQTQRRQRTQLPRVVKA